MQCSLKAVSVALPTSTSAGAMRSRQTAWILREKTDIDPTVAALDVSASETKSNMPSALSQPPCFSGRIPGCTILVKAVKETEEMVFKTSVYLGVTSNVLSGSYTDIDQVERQWSHGQSRWQKF